jgi:hypothetical protein
VRFGGCGLDVQSDHPCNRIPWASISPFRSASQSSCRNTATDRVPSMSTQARSRQKTDPEPRRPPIVGPRLLRGRQFARRIAVPTTGLSSLRRRHPGRPNFDETLKRAATSDHCRAWKPRTAPTAPDDGLVPGGSAASAAAVLRGRVCPVACKLAWPCSPGMWCFLRSAAGPD